MDTPKFEKITVPSDWSAEKDIQAFIARYGQSENYFADAERHVGIMHHALGQELDRALEYFGKAEVRALPTPEKIKALREHFRKNSPSDAYRDLFLGHLRDCEFAESEYSRIMPDYEPGHERSWLFPLVELEGLLTGAVCGFGYEMWCKYYDFKGGQRDW